MNKQQLATGRTAKGWKSSEFWVSMLGMALTIAMPELNTVVLHAPQGSWLGILGPSIIAFGYALSRGLAKHNLPPSAQQALVEQLATGIATKALESHYKNTVALNPADAPTAANEGAKDATTPSENY